MKFIPSYRCEENTDYGGPEDAAREWTMHVIEWLGLEFVLKVPRGRTEEPTDDERSESPEPLGERGFRVTGPAAKYFRGGVA